ncbi:MAG: hypothetical protein ABSG94_08815 [Brevinematales bacterium]|jgi:hypothetical protein
MSKVEIRILNENWQVDLQEAAMNTINKKWDEGKEMTEDLFRKYIISEHSPIRTVVLRIKMNNIPYPNSVHFARHVHSIPFVSTNRPDRTGKKRSAEDLCTHIFDINIQGLIDMARKRLCEGKVDKTTLDFMIEIKKELTGMGGFYKILGEMLVPNCVYRFSCPEFKGCNLLKRLFDDSDNIGELSFRYDKYNMYLSKNFFRNFDKSMIE